MVQRVLGFATLMTLLAAGLGCGSGYSSEKATQRCDQEQESKSLCMTEAAYAECIACFEECGAACEPQATCAETYACE